MKIVYVDCFAGAAGDMLLGALIDAGASVEEVGAALDGLQVAGWSLRFEETTRGPLRATRAVIDAPEETTHRHLADIERILDGAGLDPAVRRLAHAVFAELARAEGRVHGIDPNSVHFHEVGALDAIVDIVGCAAALHSLGADLVMCSPLPLGTGYADTAHGRIPLPGPAVTEILQGVPVTAAGEGETVTPTGAAFLKIACERFGPLPSLEIASVGYGAGGRTATELPNVVRVITGRAAGDPPGNTHVLLETNLDDMSPEMVPYAIARLIEAGAQDAWTTPIVMKKGRPALTLSVLAKRDGLDEVLATLYRETTTLGVRISGTGKDELERTWETVQVEGYDVRVKIGKRHGSITNVAPEYEDAAKVARITGSALKDVYRAALRAYEDASPST